MAKDNTMATYEPTTTERFELGSEGDVRIVAVTRVWHYPAGDVTLRHFQVVLADGTRSKAYQNYGNALKAWGKHLIRAR